MVMVTLAHMSLTGEDRLLIDAEAEALPDDPSKCWSVQAARWVAGDRSIGLVDALKAEREARDNFDRDECVKRVKEGLKRK